jgi:hypothetical protein
VKPLGGPTSPASGEEGLLSPVDGWRGADQVTRPAGGIDKTSPVAVRPCSLERCNPPALFEPFLSESLRPGTV